VVRSAGPDLAALYQISRPAFDASSRVSLEIAYMLGDALANHQPAPSLEDTIVVHLEESHGNATIDMNQNSW
jgi:hypothetical protein